MKEKDKILKLDYIYFIFCIILIVVQLIFNVIIRYLDNNVCFHPLGCHGICPDVCDPTISQIFKLIGFFVIPFLFIVFSICYIIKVIKNKSISLNYRIIRIIMIVVLSLIIIFLGGMVKWKDIK